MEHFTSLQIIMDGDGAFADWGEQDEQDENLYWATVDRISPLEEGTLNGKMVISFGLTTEDGDHVIGDTTWALLHSAVRAIEARYGKPE